MTLSGQDVLLPVSHCTEIAISVRADAETEMSQSVSLLNHQCHMSAGTQDTPRHHILFFSSHPLSSLTISL